MGKLSLAIILVLLAVTQSQADPDQSGHIHSPPNGKKFKDREPAVDELEQSYWIAKAQKTLFDQLNQKVNKKVAKNVIFFLGDGMSLATVTAARIYSAQKLNKTGEENFLSFEKFPHVALSKTWCVDRQTADSSCSATAYLGGVKNNFFTVGVNAKVTYNDCEAMMNPANRVFSIIKKAQDAGKSTGFATTTKVTDASPAGTYAYSANRLWESDTDVKATPGSEQCVGHDIASQLIREIPGKNLNVIFGGGRKKFVASTIDPKGKLNFNTEVQKNNLMIRKEPNPSFFLYSSISPKYFEYYDNFTEIFLKVIEVMEPI